MTQARRILVKGGSGSGKSTLARALAHHYGLPYIELDALHHGPNWQAPAATEFQARVAAALEDAQGWVVDGNYDAKLERTVVDRAELVIWLDLPLATKLARLARRSASRFSRAEVLWNGNRESLRSLFWGGDALFVWAVRSHFSQKRHWPAAFQSAPVLRLRSTQEVDRWYTALLDEPQQTLA